MTEQSRPSLRSAVVRWVVVAVVLLLAVPLALALGDRSDLGQRADAAVADLALAASDGAAGEPAPDGQSSAQLPDTPVLPGDDTTPVSEDFAQQQVEAGILDTAPAVAAAAAEPTGDNSYSGQVVDSVTGDPLAGVCVELTEANGTYRADEAAGSDCTSTDGAFGVDGLGEGPYAVDVVDPVGLHQGASDGVSFEDGDVTGVVFALEPGGAVAGTLVGTDGSPLADVCVLLSQVTETTEPSEARGCSDATGRFRTSGIAPGTTDLYVYDIAGRYLETRVGAVAVPLGGVADVGTVTLQRGASLSGQVTGSDGEPAAGLCIAVRNPAAGSGDTACTDADGRYSTVGLPSGDYQFDWYSTGRYLPPADGTVTLTAPSRTVFDLRAELGSSITGLITAADTGAPLAGVCVSASAVGGSSGGGDCTGSDGRYTIEGLAYGPSTGYRVSVGGTGPYLATYRGGGTYGTAPAVAVPTLQPVTGIDQALVRGATVAGRVTDAAGAPVRAWVSVQQLVNGYWSTVTATSTLADGTYQTRGVPTGRYVVQFADHSGAFLGEYYSDAATAGAAQQLDLSATDRTGIDAVLAPAFSISGTVSGADGGDIGSVQVVVRSAATGAWISSSSASSYTAGAYTVRGLAPGTYTVSFEPYSGSSAYAAEFYDDAASAADATPVAIATAAVAGVDAVLALGPTVSGRIADAAGSPVPGACAAVYRADSTSYPLRQVCAGPDGRYEMLGVPVGNYLIKFSSATGGFVDTWYGGSTDVADASVVAVPTAGADGIDGRLVRGGTVSGTVAVPDGGYVCVVAEPVAGGASSGSVCQTVVAGGAFRYTTPALVAGDYRIRWYDSASRAQRYYPDARSSTAAQSVPVTAGTDTTAVDGSLPALVPVSGRLTDEATGAGVAGYVYLSSTDPDATLGFYGSTSGYASADGSWTLRAEPGTYLLSYSGPGYPFQYWQGASSSDAATPITVAAGSTTRYEAVLSGGGATVSGTLRDGSGSPLSGICVRANGRTQNDVCTGADGTYRTTVAAGTYSTSWSPLTTVDPTAGRADVRIPLPGASGGLVTLRNGDQVLGADAVLPVGARLGITVTADNNSSALANVCARLLDYPGATDTFCTSAAGTISATSLVPGSYRVQLTNTAGRYATEYFDDVLSQSAATPVTVTSGQTTQIRAGLSLGGGLTGVLRLPGGSPAVGGCVALTPVAAGQGDSVSACADGAGRWTSPGLRPGDYVVGSTAPGAVPTWYPSATDVDDATPVTVVPGETTDGIDITLVAEPTSPATTTPTTTPTTTESTTSSPTTTSTSTTPSTTVPATTTTTQPTTSAPVTTTGPVTTTSEPPVTTTSEPPVTTTSEPPVTTTSEPPVTTTSEPPVTTTSEPPVTTTSEPPVTTTSEPPVTTTSEPPVTTTSEPPATTTSESPVTTTSEPSVTTEPTTTTTTSTPASGDQPPSGSPVASAPLVVDTSAAEDPAVAPGGQQTIELDGFAPLEWVRVTLYSTPVDLGWFRADAAGKLVVTFTVPAGLELGDHHVELVSATGRGISVPFVVTADGRLPAAGTGGGTSSAGAGAGSGAVVGGVPGAGSSAAGPVTPAPAAPTLAATGADALPLLGLGALVLAAGSLLTVTGVRRQARRGAGG